MSPTVIPTRQAVNEMPDRVPTFRLGNQVAAIFVRTLKGDTIFVVYDLDADSDGNEFVDVRTADITED